MAPLIYSTRRPCQWQCESANIHMSTNINKLHELDLNHSNNHHFCLLDLPDEVLTIIFKKLRMANALFSLVNVNTRLDRLALDPLYIRDLDLTDTVAINSMHDQTCSVDTQVLSKICQEILPRIHHQVHQLTLEEYSIKDILVPDYYPQLYSLSLLNFNEEMLHQSLTDNFILRDLLTKQITHLSIDIKTTTELTSPIAAESFRLVLMLCQNLHVLNYGDMFLTRKCYTPVYVRSRSAMSTTLTKLKINVGTFVDCLILLDGRLPRLSTLIVNVITVFKPIIDINQEGIIPNMKCFTFTLLSITAEYDQMIVPLLRRMINLEELQLDLLVTRFNSNYIDGIQLYEQFLTYMTQLNKFTFNIKMNACTSNVSVKLQSNEDIQRSFIGRCYQQVASYVETDSSKTQGTCHIYSLPFAFDCLRGLNNCFQGGMFDQVRYLTMNDHYPFEYKFFQSISQKFPFLKYLCISNVHSQKRKHASSIPITFPYLTFLDLRYAHVDYAKQFLLKSNAHLPRLLNLCVKYRSLRTMTNEFTNDAELFNFCTLRFLDVCESSVHPENFRQYFPLLYNFSQ